jgi:NAD(P)-dependent dehydrogenase (short-subunit alcohol dehydrogenase family)
MANDIAGTFGPVEVLVNSAAVTAPLGPTAGLPLLGIVRALRVNVLSVMTLAAAVVPQVRPLAGAASSTS